MPSVRSPRIESIWRPPLVSPIEVSTSTAVLRKKLTKVGMPLLPTFTFASACRSCMFVGRRGKVRKEF